MPIRILGIFFIITWFQPPCEAASEPGAITQGETQSSTGEAKLVSTLREPEFIYPSNWGQAGLFRMRAADSLPSGSLTFGIGGEFYAVNNSPAGSAESLAETLFVGFSPMEHLTVSVIRKSSSTTFGNPQQLISSLGDFYFSGKYSIPITPIMALAPILNVLIASNFNNLAPAGDTVSVGAGLAYSLGFRQWTGVPLIAHANLIYHIPQIRNAGPVGITTQNFFDFSRFHTLTWSLGAELKLGDLMPFVEFQQTAQFNSQISFGNFPSKGTLGLRFTPLSNKGLSILLGADVGLGKGLTAGVPFTPDYQIIGQVSYTVGLSQTERKHYYANENVNVVDRKFVIRKKIRFKLNSAELSPESYGLLDDIADVIRKNGVKRLLIAGHTDSTASEKYNLKLSKSRADSVKRYLVSKGIPSGTLESKGLGKRKPRASNLTEEGRSLNRRVEFFILE